MPNESRNAPFYRRKSFWIAVAVWVLLTLMVLFTDESIADAQALVFICHAVSLLLMVMCAYLKAITPGQITVCLSSAILCLFAAWINVVGFFVSMASHLLFLAGLLQFVIYCIMAVVLGISHSIRKK
ncbi:MAG: hypothetical protein RRY21_02930 [Oscillospiraceae bacterium]